MADVFTKEKRSEIMSKIRSVSMMEKKFVSMLSQEIYPKGYRYRLNYKKVPGKPDIAFVSRKLAIFIDGDFWHGYDFNNRKQKLPETYWREKIEANIKRDRINRRKLTRLGWQCLRIWEHEIKKDHKKCILRIVRMLEKIQRLA